MDAEELDLLEGVVEEGLSNLEDARQLLCTRGVKSGEGVDHLFRVLHTIKGNASMLGLDAVAGFSHQVEEVLDQWRNDQIDPSLHLFRTLESAVDSLTALLLGVRQNPELGLDPRAQELMAELARISDPEQAQVATASPDASPSSASERAGTGLDESADSVRIPTQLLDNLINTAGSLLYLGERLRFFNTRSTEGNGTHSSELPEISLSLGTLLDELHETLLSARLESVGRVTRSLERIVREASRDTGRLIRFNTTGQATRIDRQMLRALHDPLVHMLRNAVDHGIEDPQVRAAAGKPEQATVELQFAASEHWVRLELRDDGNGMDANALLQRATEKGVITAEQAATMSEEQALRLIFSPGFSTAKSVSNLSGRGVGMDVVRRTIEDLGGFIDIHTKPGSGTSFQIAIPQPDSPVVDGMVVRIGDATYLIPLDAVDGFQDCGYQNMSEIFGDARITTTDTSHLPVIELEGPIHTREDSPTTMVYLAAAQGIKYALLVHEVLGRHRVLVRSLSIPAKECSQSRGAFLLGDGKIGFLLSPDHLLNQLRRNGPGPRPSLD